MSIQAMKLEVIEWITKLEDQRLLETLLSLKQSSKESDWWKDLTLEQVQSIERGISDHESGRTMTGEQFWKDHEKEI